MTSFYYLWSPKRKENFSHPETSVNEADKGNNVIITFDDLKLMDNDKKTCTRNKRRLYLARYPITRIGNTVNKTIENSTKPHKRISFGRSMLKKKFPTKTTRISTKPTESFLGRIGKNCNDTMHDNTEPIFRYQGMSTNQLKRWQVVTYINLTNSAIC